MKRLSTLFSVSTVVLTLFAIVAFRLGERSVGISGGASFLLIFMFMLVSAALTGLLMRFTQKIISSNYAEISTLTSIVASKYGNLVKGVQIVITDIPEEETYLPRIYFFGKRPVSHDTLKPFKDYRIMEMQELDSALVSMLKKKESAVVNQSERLAVVYGTKRMGNMLVLEIRIKAKDAELFGIVPEYQDEATRIAKKMAKLYPQARGIMLIVTGQSMTVRYNPQIYSFNDQTEQELQRMEDPGDLCSFSRMPTSMVDSLLKGEMPVDTKILGVFNFANIVPLLNIEMDVATAENYDLPTEEVETSVVVPMRVRNELAKDPSVQGIVVTITDVPDNMKYLDQAYPFNEETEKVLNNAEEVMEICDLDDMDSDLEAVFRGDKESHKVTFGSTTIYLGKVKMLQVHISEEDASGFGIEGEELEDHETITCKVRAKYGDEVQGIYLRIVDQKPEEDFTDLAFPLDDADISGLSDIEPAYDEQGLDGSYSSFEEFLLGDSYQDKASIIGVEVMGKDVAMLVIEVTADAAYRTFDIEGEEVEEGEIVARILKAAHGDNIQGLVVEVIEQPLDEDYKDLIYLFNDADSDGLEKSEREHEEQDVSDMDSDLLDAIKDPTSNKALRCVGPVTYGSLTLVLFEVKAEDSGQFSFESIEPDDTVIAERTVQHKYGAEVTGVIIRITNQPTDETYLPVVAFFDSEVSLPRSAEVNLLDLSDLDQNILNVLKGEKDTDVKVGGIEDISTEQGPAKVLCLKIDAEEAENYSISAE